ncbi:MAG: dihydroorotate dehydrogenase-like protein [Anaerolineae bacterium]|nr:dihydroorotate dehydrogenase-like protein [Anaerolineae bacterium]
MVDISTNYLGLTLRSPLVASASPLSENVDNIRRMEDAGAGAVVLFSLFEEQIRREREALFHYLTHGTETFAEAITYFPEPEQYHAGPDAYLELIRKAKKAVNIPVIASLNGMSIGGWTKFARKMQDAGADALELNIYYIPTDPNLTGYQVEQTYVEIVKAVKSAVTIPVAVKLGPYFSNMANMAVQLDEAGANALVLFNRFYQPDIDLETLDVVPNVILSTTQAMRLPLTWIGILYKRINADLAATSGIHTSEDAIKMILAGANVTMMTSALLKNGIDHLRIVEQRMREWMEAREYESVRQMRGSVSQMHAENPEAFERAQYMRALTSYQPPVSLP